METANPKEKTSDERIWAALAHGSILLVGFGAIVPVGVWASQRDKSAWVSFQALQALVYNLLQQIILFGMLIIGMIPMALLIIPLTEAALTSDPTGQEMLPLFGFMLWPLFAIGLYIGLGLLGAALCLFGVNFRYPLIGGWVNRYLSREEDGWKR